MTGIRKRLGSLLGPEGQVPQFIEGTTTELEPGEPAQVNLTKTDTAEYRVDFQVPSGAGMDIKVGGPMPSNGWWLQLPSISISDDFDRPDTTQGGTLGTTPSGGLEWVDVHGVYSISSSQAGTDSWSYAVALVDLDSADATVSAVFNVLQYGDHPRGSVAARYEDVDNYYEFGFWAKEQQIVLTRARGGTYQYLWTGDYHTEDGGLYDVELTAETVPAGVRLRGRVNGDQKFDLVDDDTPTSLPQGTGYGFTLNRPSYVVAVDSFKVNPSLGQ